MTKQLTSLVRKGLIRPDIPQLPGEDGFRFRHLLIRDAAYDAIPKSTRAEAHQRFAGWLDEHGEAVVELDELLGYHLEQAHRYRTELGTRDARSVELGSRAAELLAAAGRRSLGRGDASAASSLLGRAASLLPAESPTRLELLPELGLARRQMGDLAAAEAIFDEAIDAAIAIGDRRIELHALLGRFLVRVASGSEAVGEEMLHAAQQAIPVFTELGDEAGLARAWSAIAFVKQQSFQTGAALEACERGLEHARRAGRPELEDILPDLLCANLVYGSTRVEAALQRIDQLPRRHPSRPPHEALLLAMLARFDEARALCAEDRQLQKELGRTHHLAINAQERWAVEMLAGDLAAAEREAREGCERLQQLGDRGFLSTQACQLALTLHALERDEEAEHWANLGQELGATDDLVTQLLWRQVRAKILARRGERDEGERLARAAVALAEQSGFLNMNGNALIDLAEVLELAGRVEEAAATLEQALALYERKGNIVSATSTRTRIAAHQQTAPPGR